MTTRNELLDELRREIFRTQHDLETSPAPAGLIPLKIKCVMASCRNGHHSLDYNRKDRAVPVAPGSCRDCGEQILELPVLGGRDYDDEAQFVDIAKTQQSELIRAHYWTVPFDLRAYNQALRFGMQGLRERADRKVRSNLLNIEFGRRRAPYSGDIIAYAQHATATCCRQCAVYWHGFPPEGAPTESQLRFAVAMATSYLEARLNFIPEEPSVNAVPPVRTADHISGDPAANIERTIRGTLANDGDPAGLVIPMGTCLETVHERHSDGSGYVRLVHPDDGTLFQVG